jgi:16S rRNA (guanine966-N2)-methyltransferase
VRVIGGSARGRKLQAPPRPRTAGRPGIRPTSDMIREVIFDMLDAMGADYDRVLDLYAGTGALGIEALSRGEGTCDFVDSGEEAVRIIRENLRLTGFGPRAEVHRMAAETAPARLRGPYSLVLADPPYYDSEALAAVSAVAASPLPGPQCVFVLEHHRRTEAPDALPPFTRYRRRRHGDTVVSIYEQEGPA